MPLFRDLTVKSQESNVVRLLLNPDDGECIASAKAINTVIAKNLNSLAILAGDLNDTPESCTLDVFDQKWATANKQPQPTLPVTKPTWQIDFLPHPPSLQVRRNLSARRTNRLRLPAHPGHAGTN